VAKAARPSAASAVELALGAAVGVSLLGGGSTAPPASAAFTVTVDDNGTVTASVNRLEDAEGLERHLEQYGIPTEVDYLPVDMRCEQARFTPAPHSARAVEFWFADPDAVEDVGHEVPYTLIVHPDRLGPNQTVVLEAGRDVLGPEDGGGPAMWARTPPHVDRRVGRLARLLIRRFARSGSTSAGEDVPAPSVAAPMTPSCTGVMPNIPVVVAVGASAVSRRYGRCCRASAGRARCRRRC
jgi:hypothetical protein